MKRLHIHVGVEQLAPSIKFYSTLFAAEPVKVKDDYAKWMLSDPRVNFAISTRVKPGVDHLGLQVDEASELDELRTRLQNSETALFDEGETTCCYAHSDKSWVTDPSGIPWEAFQTMEDVKLFSGKDSSPDNACCTPEIINAGADDSAASAARCCA